MTCGQEGEMARIVVVGAGLGGMSAAYELRETLGKGHEVTLVGKGELFGFTPSNPWLAVGWRKPEEITLKVADHVGRHGIAYNGDGVERIDAEGDAVVTGAGERIPYDYLMICTGPKLAFDEVAGTGPDGGFTQSICTTPHAQHAWEAYQAFLDNPGPIVIGAVQGASCFGPAYEFAMIVDADLRKRKLRDKVPMTFVSSEPYVGHMGLGGVGDSKGLMEAEMRQRHIKWICNAKTTKVEAGRMYVTEHNDQGQPIQEHVLPFKHSMMLPAFKGVDAVFGIEGLTNPRGFITIDKHQRNTKYPNIYAVGVCVAIPPVEATPVPVGTPKTGYMIESMNKTTAKNIRMVIDGQQPSEQATWNAICLADFGDRGAAFIAMPQIPPRNTSWFGEGKWVHYAKVGFEKYFMYKMKRGTSETFYEKMVLDAMGIMKMKNEK